jgi:hypothetical protein
VRKSIAIKLVGGLSNTSKMPGSSMGLPTAHCKTGSRLAKVAGTVCSMCYAQKGHYKMYAHTVVPAQQRRLDAFEDPQWVEAMTTALDNARWFRWFDSGDLQSVGMLLKIFEVARATPWCNHWLATRERDFVRRAAVKSEVPDNMVIRVSATFPDVPVKPIKVENINYANVHKAKAPVGHACPAPQQGGECGPCRACWSRDVLAVSYHQH